MNESEEMTVVEQPWFKVWAKESLGSADLLSLTDHEERVWWRLLSVASVQEPRWTITLSRPVLAHMCASTAAKLDRALHTFEGQEMVILDKGGAVTIANWEKYQETPEARRQRRHREKEQRDSSVTEGVTCHAESHANVTTEEEEEEEEDLTPTLRSGVSGAAKPPPRPRGKPRPNRLGPLTEDIRAAILRDFPDIPDIECEIEYAMSYQTKATDTNLYLRRWMRMEREKLGRKVVNGRQVQRGNKTQDGHHGRDADLDRILDRARREDAELERSAQ